MPQDRRLGAAQTLYEQLELWFLNHPEIYDKEDLSDCKHGHIVSNFLAYVHEHDIG